MAPPVTKFAVKDPYTYLHGFGNYHESEAFPNTLPVANNSPQKPAYGLRTERISGSSFTAQRERNMQTFMYRETSSLKHSEFVPLQVSTGYGPDQESPPTHINPNSYSWNDLPVPERAHWINGQKLLGRNGDPQKKEGIALWVFSVNEDMPARHAFASLDGELLVVPQAGALDIQTEMGRMMVRQNEIAVIPRNVRHRVTLAATGADGAKKLPCRGYVCELFQGHFQLPTLGIIGSTGLANVRDFEVPTAHFDGQVGPGGVAKADGDGEEWSIVARLDGRRWHCTQNHTPFDVAGWHGMCYPYKYDLARFCVLGNLLFDEHDPCLFTVLTAPNHGAAPGTAVVDFAMIPPRYMAAEDTMWLPYYHRNTMQEFFGPIVNNQSPRYPFNDGKHGFSPFAAGLHGAMSTHGPMEGEFQAMRELDTSKPKKMQTEGITVFLCETERPLFLSDWAFEHAVKNPQTKPRLAKM